MSQEANHNPENFAEQVTSPIGKTRAAAIKDEVPDTIGAYRIDRAMPGIRGGMGTVYRAFNVPSLGGYVAIKVMQDADDTPEALALFEEEARKANLARHPNVVQMLYAGHFVDGPRVRPYYVMEWIDDAVMLTDERLLKRLSIRERVELFVKVCRTVEHGHQRGVVHGDLKPSNIVVANWRDDPTLKVLDFGLARAMRGWRAEQLPVAGGTPRYMSPELSARHGRDPDARSDVYALGVMLREVLLPSWEASRHVLVDGRLRSIISNSTAGGSRESDRYTDAAQLAAALERWLGSRSAHAWHKWNRWAFAWPGVAAVALALVIALFAWTIGTPLMDKTPVFHRFERVMDAGVQTVDNLSRVLVVQLTDECVTPALDAAGLDKNEKRTRDGHARLIWAHLLNRLSDAGASVIVFDVWYPGERPHTRELADAVAKAIANGKRVVVGRNGWSDKAGDVHNAVYDTPRLMSGPMTANPDPDKPTFFVPVFVERAGYPSEASIAALASAAWKRGKGFPEFVGFDEWDLLFNLAGTNEQDRLLLHGVHTQFTDPGQGIYLGSKTGFLRFATLPDTAYANSTISVKDLLKLSDSQVSSMVAGKVVLVGDATIEGDDSLRAVGRPDDHKFYIQAGAVQLLTGSRVTRYAAGEEYFLACAVACLVAIAVAWSVLGSTVHNSARTRIAALMLAGGLVMLGVVGVIAVCFQELGWYCHPAMPTLASGSGVAFAFLLPRVRSKWLGPTLS